LVEEVNPLDLIFWSFLAALGAVGLTVLVRNAPGINGLVMEAKRPWACNICMSLYSSALVVSMLGLWLGNWNYGVVFLPVYALTLIVLDRMSKPPGPPEIPAEFLKGGSDAPD
jgi:hypothetical protein